MDITSLRDGELAAVAESSQLSGPSGSYVTLELGVLVMITAFSAVLCFHSLAAKSFWFDEGVSVVIARLDWSNFLRILWRREANMSLYYLLLHFWLQLGSSEFFIRTLSVVFALATIPALYLLGRRLFDSRVGLIAAALLAVNAYFVRYSQEARSYTLMLFLCVLSSLYFLKHLANSSRRNRLAYVLISALAVYAHFFAGLLVLAQWLSLRFLDRQRIPQATRKVWRWMALSVSPAAVFVATTGAGPLRWVKRPGPKELEDLALRLTGNGGWLLLFAYAFACLAALIPVWRLARQRSSGDLWRYRFLVFWLFFPVLLTVAVSFARPLFLPRYFFFCLPALLLLAASGLARLRAAWMLAPALLLFLALSLRGTASYYQQDFDLQREDWRAASHYLLTNARLSDAAMFHVPMGRMPYEYYHSLLGTSLRDPVVLYPHHGDRITFLDFVEKPDYTQLEHLTSQYQRVWLVLSQVGGPSGPDAVTTALQSLLGPVYVNVEQHNYAGLEILLYSKTSPAD
jgi:mannosyltransferase